MKNIFEKIEKYLRENLGKKNFVLNNRLAEEDCDIWGFDSIKILVKENGNTVHYYPVFRSA